MPAPRTATERLARHARPAVPGLPKYAQLRDQLIAAIRAGEWKPGDKLPTEQELARGTPYSLGTVQRALRELVEEGLVVRAQGSGTFVAEGHAPIDAPLHLRFLGGDGEPRFLPLYPKVLKREVVRVAGPWSEWLGGLDREIVRIDRRLSVNREFNLFNRFYVSARTFPEIATRTLKSLDGVNLKQLLASLSAMPITNVEQRVCLVTLPKEACQAINVRPGTRGMLLESAASAGRGHPAYYLESFIPPNGRRLDVTA